MDRIPGILDTVERRIPVSRNHQDSLPIRPDRTRLFFRNEFCLKRLPVSKRVPRLVCNIDCNGGHYADDNQGDPNVVEHCLTSLILKSEAHSK